MPSDLPGISTLTHCTLWIFSEMNRNICIETGVNMGLKYVDCFTTQIQVLKFVEEFRMAGSGRSFQKPNNV
jgi:hypothetical protein